jgi:hypothetical protein
MTMTATPPARERLAARLFYAIPVIGWIARDISRGVENVFYALAIAALALVIGVQTIGLAAITLTALALVPLMFLAIIWITLP